MFKHKQTTRWSCKGILYDSLKSGDLEALCIILEDETNKNQLADGFIVNVLKM